MSGVQDPRWNKGDSGWNKDLKGTLESDPNQLETRHHCNSGFLPAKVWKCKWKHLRSTPPSKGLGTGDAFVHEAKSSGSTDFLPFL